ncbi:ABC transporter permease [Tepidibacter thalassicus]|uniref:Transport permease protein n=1 Tax=Tepidibacter thalassicus DSM 15285 TaxID=1123350 RepID=A0A1M5S6J0_9FIRM|nr:ABC transporter permease [Tepidibacter thalassicus]SHH33898.1 ABC-type polysaccharide/polyol phosphate export permease [Tepidibacter thalassicus DSM 15285]
MFIIFELAKNDFKAKYAGSYLGVIWGFIQPIITILVFWFVFQVGFKTPPIEKDIPFILWLVCGMIPWFFFSDGFVNATNCLLEYSYLVKKVVFRVSILPIVKILSSIFVHLFFVVFIFIMFFLYGNKLSIYNIQVFYYSFSIVILLLGLSFITSSINVFLKDTVQIVSIIIQFGFWLTPIFWSYKNIPVKYVKFFKLNPMYYIVQGYRDAFINHVWFWERYNQTIYFWCLSILILTVGVFIFKRLRPHFSDVL